MNADPSHFLSSLRNSLVKLFMVKIQSGFVTYRVADELPWQLFQSNDKQELYTCIEMIAMLTHYWQKGKLSLLVQYWKCLGVNITEIYQIYYEKLKILENDSSYSQQMFVYDILGKLLYVFVILLL